MQQPPLQRTGTPEHCSVTVSHCRYRTSSSMAKRSCWMFQQLLSCTGSTAGLLTAGTQCGMCAAGSPPDGTRPLW